MLHFLGKKVLPYGILVLPFSFILIFYVLGVGPGKLPPIDTWSSLQAGGHAGPPLRGFAWETMGVWLTFLDFLIA